MARQRHDPCLAKVARERGQQGRLARTRRADHDHVQPAARGDAQQVGHRSIEDRRGDQAFEGRLARRAAAQDQHRPVRRRRRKDHQAFAAVAQAKGDGRRRRMRHQPADEFPQIRVVAELLGRGLEHPVALDVERAGSVDEQRVDRPVGP